MTNIQKTDTELTKFVNFIQKTNLESFHKDIYLITLYVAGLDYIDNIDEIFSNIDVGDKLELFREPENEFDKRAILIKYHGEKIGYIPKKDNLILANLMDGGKELYAIVKEFGVDSVYEGYEFRFINFKVFLKEDF